MKFDLSLFTKIENSNILVITNHTTKNPFALYLPESNIYLDLLNFRILRGNLNLLESDLKNTIIAFASEKNTLGETFLIPRLFFNNKIIAIYLGF